MPTTIATPFGLMLAWVGLASAGCWRLGAVLLALPLAGLLVVRGAGGATRIPFGPFMLASAALVLVISLLW